MAIVNGNETDDERALRKSRTVMKVLGKVQYFQHQETQQRLALSYAKQTVEMLERQLEDTEKAIRNWSATLKTEIGDLCDETHRMINERAENS